jgi:hypothetical protein
MDILAAFENSKAYWGCMAVERGMHLVVKEALPTAKKW